MQESYINSSHDMEARHLQHELSYKRDLIRREIEQLHDLNRQIQLSSREGFDTFGDQQYSLTSHQFNPAHLLKIESSEELLPKKLDVLNLTRAKSLSLINTTEQSKFGTDKGSSKYDRTQFQRLRLNPMGSKSTDLISGHTASAEQMHLPSFKNLNEHYNVVEGRKYISNALRNRFNVPSEGPDTLRRETLSPEHHNMNPRIHIENQQPNFYCNEYPTEQYSLRNVSNTNEPSTVVKQFSALRSTNEHS